MEYIKDVRPTDDGIQKEDTYFNTTSGTYMRAITTKYWDVNVVWKYGTYTWVPMKAIKASNSFELT